MGCRMPDVGRALRRWYIEISTAPARHCEIRHDPMTDTAATPRAPHAAALYLALLATTAGLTWVERALSKRPARPAPRDGVPSRLIPGSWLFAAGCLLLALGFQVHFSLNSAGQGAALSDKC